MGVKSVQTLGVKIRFSSLLDIFFRPFPRNNVDTSLSSTAQTTAPTQHWIEGPGSIRDLTLDANKFEQILKEKFI